MAAGDGGHEALQSGDADSDSELVGVEMAVAWCIAGALGREPHAISMIGSDGGAGMCMRC